MPAHELSQLSRITRIGAGHLVGRSMAKIPVEKTIGETYGFLFKNILSIVGIVWFPYLVFGGIAGALLWYALGQVSFQGLNFEPGRFNIGPLIALLRLMPAIVFCLILAVLIATVGLVRKALGLMPGPIFVFFTLGAPVWRLFAALILIEMIVGAFVGICVAIGAAWAAFGVPHLSHPVGVLVDVIGVVAMVCVGIYMTVRFFFFVPAVVVAEEKIGLGRSWQLGGGNFWRIVVVVLMVILPPAIVLGIVQNVATTLL